MLTSWWELEDRLQNGLCVNVDLGGGGGGQLSLSPCEADGQFCSRNRNQRRFTTRLPRRRARSQSAAFARLWGLAAVEWSAVGVVQQTNMICGHFLLWLYRWQRCNGTSQGIPWLWVLPGQRAPLTTLELCSRLTLVLHSVWESFPSIFMLRGKVYSHRPGLRFDSA